MPDNCGKFAEPVTFRTRHNTTQHCTHVAPHPGATCLIRNHQHNNANVLKTHIKNHTHTANTLLAWLGSLWRSEWNVYIFSILTCQLRSRNFLLSPPAVCSAKVTPNRREANRHAACTQQQRIKTASRLLFRPTHLLIIE